MSPRAGDGCSDLPQPVQVLARSVNYNHATIYHEHKPRTVIALRRGYKI